MSAVTLKSSVKCFEGEIKTFSHASKSTSTEMTFAVFFPPSDRKVPVLFWLSGLTCTHENFMIKAGAQKYAAEKGIAIVCPDTSPRGVGAPGEDDSYDFGTGAGFYVDAVTEGYAAHYHMYTYVAEELPALLQHAFGEKLDLARVSIAGHSMGGHGALSIALKNPGKFKSCSAFAPISNPCSCPWGKKAFTGYFGEDKKALWEAHDSSLLLSAYAGPHLDVLVDQGSSDNFLADGQLHPETLEAAAAKNKNVALSLHFREGYDHSYFFIASFIENHINFHAKHLQG
eukprot:GCRY01001601.1.p1 GENE.GCRY01001601.1~~GCRY01001601.1.p1  ORF type:complete len:319 (+),score=75.86 GCRY01001601.1:100-957(+)